MQSGNPSGDFDRVTFDPIDRFASVLWQQGRMQLPADGNEQSAIHHHFLRQLIIDLKGRSWRPGDGFKIRVSADGKTVDISPGHFYVDGILCENEATRTFEEQPHFPVPQSKKSLEDLLKDSEPFGLYLDCWERHVTWLNDPRLREVALGGPDTTTRLQIAWQVRSLSFDGAHDELGEIVKALSKFSAASDDEKTAAAAKKKAAESKRKAGVPADVKDVWGSLEAALDTFDDALPRLAADANWQSDELDPCAISADAQYRGRENQLYRIEIHEGGLDGQATFKWSRENGSTAFRVLDIESDATATRVTLESLGRDRRTGLCEGNWVELSDDDSETQRQADALLQVVKIDSQRRVVTLEGKSNVNPSRHAILRRWDHQEGVTAEGTLIVAEKEGPTGWMNIERGLRVRFAPGGYYRTGDAWQVLARVNAADVRLATGAEWPQGPDGPRALPPQGVKHHRALIAVVDPDKKKGAVQDKNPKP